MNRLLIDLDALRHNCRVVSKWVAQHGESFTVVTKALCGHADLIRALNDFGMNSMGDSRIENLRRHPKDFALRRGLVSAPAARFRAA